MIVKAEITSIDYSSNTCIIRMPVFESSSSVEKAIASAIFAISPGVYNGYQEGDVVLVGFENGQLHSPVVIGKLYLGNEEENKKSRGTINCNMLVSETSCDIPLLTKLSSEESDAVNVNGAANTYKNIKEIIETVNKQALTIQELTNRIEELEKK